MKSRPKFIPQLSNFGGGTAHEAATHICAATQQLRNTALGDLPGNALVEASFHHLSFLCSGPNHLSLLIQRQPVTYNRHLNSSNKVGQRSRRGGNTASDRALWNAGLQSCALNFSAWRFSHLVCLQKPKDFQTDLEAFFTLRICFFWRKSRRLPPTAYYSSQNQNAAGFPHKCLCPQFPTLPRSLTNADESQCRRAVRSSRWESTAAKCSSRPWLKCKHFHAAVALARPRYRTAFIEAARTSQMMMIHREHPVRRRGHRRRTTQQGELTWPSGLSARCQKATWDD